MKKYTNTELKKIFNDIVNGAVYVGIDNYNRGVGSVFYDGFNYIYFKHYGQTACKKNFEHFRNVVQIMFGECSEIVPGVYSKYHINYIPKDLKKYGAIDFSTNHPNACGY